VLDRARRIRREVEAMRVDLSMLQGLETGESSLGIVGTASRWVVPPLVAEVHRRAPGLRLRVVEGASERLMADVASGELAMAVVTEPVTNNRLVAETLLEEALVGVVPKGMPLPSPPVPLAALVERGLVLPARENPLRHEVEQVAEAQGVELPVTVEVEGIRLVADLVAAGAGASVLPETAVPHELSDVDVVPIADMPPRRLALVIGRDTNLSLADLAVRADLRGVVERGWASERRSGPHR
jgi:DNA-binding transcriptional LysR family regulator